MRNFKLEKLKFKDKKMERKRNAQLYLVLRGVIAVLTAAGIWNEVTIMSTNLLVSMKNLNKQKVTQRSRKSSEP